MPKPSSPHSRRRPTPACFRSVAKWSTGRISFRRGAFSNGRTGKGRRMAEAVYPVPEGFNARIGPTELAELNDLANADPDRFWLDQAQRLTWNKFPTRAGDWSFKEEDFGIRWFADGELNL